MKSDHNFANMIQVKLDLSVVQDALAGTIKDIYSRLTQLEATSQQISQTHGQTAKQITKLYELIEESNEKNSLAVKQLQQRFMNLRMAAPSQGAISDVIQKTPQQVLDHIENRLQLNNLSPRGLKDIDMNFSPPNTDRLVQTFRVKENSSARNDKELLDQKVYSIYEKTVEKIESEITQLRKDFRFQLEEFTAKSTKILQDKECQGNQTYHNDGTNTDDLVKSRRSSMGKAIQSNRALANLPVDGQAKQVANSRNSLGGSTKQMEEGAQDVYPAQSSSNFNDEEVVSPLQKIQIKEYLQELKKEVKAELIAVVKNAEDKLEEINRTNSVIADHLVEAKKSMQDLINDKDTLKIQIAGMRQKGSTAERQLCLLIDSSNEHKNKLKSLENSFNKINQEIKEYKSANEMIREEPNEDQFASKKDPFRESNSSFRSSVQGNLNPIRNNSILKMNSNKIEGLEETIKSMSSKIGNLIDRLNKMQDQKRRLQLQQFGSSLPKIDKENKSNVNPIEIIKKQLKKVNEDIIKTNQKLNGTKDRLNELYESHADIPNKIEDIYIKLRENNEIQEDRLIELIKELINRALADPFDNNFTNRLKREINVKFLEIKHEYNCILKEIESKVQNRVEIKELQKVAQKFQESVLEVKSIASKKCQTQDFKKGIKYLQSKVKQVFQFAKSQTVALANEQKQYIGAKKQQLH